MHGSLKTSLSWLANIIVDLDIFLFTIVEVCDITAIKCRRPRSPVRDSRGLLSWGWTMRQALEVHALSMARKVLYTEICSTLSNICTSIKNIPSQKEDKLLEQLLNKEKLSLDCQCGHKIKESLGRLKKNPNLTCSRCKALIAVNADQLAKAIKSIKKQEAEFRRKIEKLSKSIKLKL